VQIKSVEEIKGYNSSTASFLISLDSSLTLVATSLFLSTNLFRVRFVLIDG
jgi:hypothetical protein